MANAPNTKQPVLLADALAYGREQSDTPYENLLTKAAEDGWNLRLTQRGEPVAHAHGVLINFDVLLGKDGGPLERVETITFNTSPTIGPVSMLARMNANTTLIHLFFGRLPPEPDRAPAPPADEPTYVREADDTPPPRERVYADEPDIAVVERRTPDGLPIFGDLYALGQPGPVVVEAVLDVMSDTLPEVTSIAALTALWTNNVEAMQYVQDLGESDQRQQLKRMLDRRKSEIEDGGSVAPRRRSPQVVN